MLHLIRRGRSPSLASIHSQRSVARNTSRFARCPSDFRKSYRRPVSASVGRSLSTCGSQPQLQQLLVAQKLCKPNMLSPQSSAKLTFSIVFGAAVRIDPIFNFRRRYKLTKVEPSARLVASGKNRENPSKSVETSATMHSSPS